ncbi:hypothetical protein CR51_41495 [Caballeronia megalochromosomata]|jgi:hypothetical protein|nr:hypothetical protein CR51_41495 [Caballeronia megalochromosomata]
MPEALNWNISVNVTGGPQLSSAAALEVDAYDKLEVKLASDNAPHTVKMGPGTWADVSLVLIMPSQFGDALTYKAGAVTAKLDGTHLLLGAGAVALLGAGNAQLDFTNNTGADVTLEILVGRKAS